MSYEPASYLYFIQCKATRLIKIGITQGSLEARLRAILSMSPMPLEFDRLGVMRGWRATERKLHGRFAHLRHHGEWFRPEADLLDFIGRHAKPWPEPVSPWRGPAEDDQMFEDHERALDELIDWAWSQVTQRGKATPYHNLEVVARMYNAMARHNGRPEFDIETGQLVTG
jgi:hypothetical protein